MNTIQISIMGHVITVHYVQFDDMAFEWWINDPDEGPAPGTELLDTLLRHYCAERIESVIRNKIEWFQAAQSVKP